MSDIIIKGLVLPAGVLRQETFPSRWIIAAFGAVGFVAGMFAGASASPVVGPLLSGLFGAVGGVGAIWFVAMKAEAQTPILHKRTLAVGVCVSCLLMVIGLFCGSEMRTGNMRKQWFSESLKSFDEISRGNEHNIDADAMAAFIMLQRTLDHHEVDPKSGNRLMEGLYSSFLAYNDQLSTMENKTNLSWQSADGEIRTTVEEMCAHIKALTAAVDRLLPHAAGDDDRARNALREECTSLRDLSERFNKEEVPNKVSRLVQQTRAVRCYEGMNAMYIKQFASAIRSGMLSKPVLQPPVGAPTIESPVPAEAPAPPPSAFNDEFPRRVPITDEGDENRERAPAPVPAPAASGRSHFRVTQVRSSK